MRHAGRIIFVLLFVALALSAAVAIAFRRAPALLESALERELGKDASLTGVRYHFPLGLEIQKLAVLEKGEFAGETSLYVENVTLNLDPSALMNGRVVIPRVELRSPQVTIRIKDGHLIHAFSKETGAASPAVQSSEQKAAGKPGSDSPDSTRSVPLRIGTLDIRGGYLKWIDYDISKEGFALTCQIIEARIEGIFFGGENERTRYEIVAAIQQTRDRAPAKVWVAGWTNFATYDTDARATIQNLWLPYFGPYFARVSSAVVEDGSLSAQSTARVMDRKVLANAHLELRDLAFASFEPGGNLFGFEAAPLIDILRNQVGRITLDLVVERNLADPNETFRQAMRRSIEKSIKATFLNNLQTVAENALQRLTEDPDGAKKDWKSLVDQFTKSVN